MLQIRRIIGYLKSGIIGWKVESVGREIRISQWLRGDADQHWKIRWCKMHACFACLAFSTRTLHIGINCWRVESVRREIRTSKWLRGELIIVGKISKACMGVFRLFE